MTIERECECIDIRGINHDYLKAIATVKIPEIGLIISDLKLFKKNDSYWVSLPTREYEKDGKKNYFQFIKFIDKEEGDKLLAKIRDCILKELKVGIQANSDNKREFIPNNRVPEPDFFSF